MRLRSSVAALLLTFLAGAPAARASGFGIRNAGFLSGIARDARGQTLADVEIVVLARGGSTSPIASIITDASGRFLLRELPVGIYRVAAIKSGYLAVIGQVNTSLRSTVDFVLRPAPLPGEAGSERVPIDPSWVLRVPRRSILRETTSVALLRGGSDLRPGQGETGGDRPPLEGHVDHLVALAGWDSGGGASSVRGGETSVYLRGALGRRGTVSVLGRRESLDTPGMAVDRVPAIDRESMALAVDLALDTEQDGTLAMKAYWNRRGFETAGPTIDPVASEREASRTFGYDASWSRQVDAGSRIAVQVGFLDASLDLEAADSSMLLGSGPRRDLSNRVAGAEGSYELDAGAGHQVRVGVRAQMLDLADPALRSGPQEMVFGAPLTPGWSVAVDAGDTWSAVSSWDVIYGIGVEQVLSHTGSTLVVPRVGTAWKTPRFELRAVANYHLVSVEPDSSGQPPPVFRPASRTGYEADAELRLSPRSTWRVGYAYTPIQFDAVGGSAARTGSPLYLTDGNAAERRTTVTLEQDFDRGKAWFEVLVGRADGTLAHLAAYEMPVLVLDERALNFGAVRVGTRWEGAGTDLQAEYRRLNETPLAGSDSSVPSRQSYVELRLVQEIIRLRSVGASCRLLVSVRTPTGGNEAPAGPDEAILVARRAAASNHRIGAGLSVAF